MGPAAGSSGLALIVGIWEGTLNGLVGVQEPSPAVRFVGGGGELGADAGGVIDE